MSRNWDCETQQGVVDSSNIYGFMQSFHKYQCLPSRTNTQIKVFICYKALTMNIKLLNYTNVVRSIRKYSWIIFTFAKKASAAMFCTAAPDRAEQINRILPQSSGQPPGDQHQSASVLVLTFILNSVNSVLYINFYQNALILP